MSHQCYVYVSKLWRDDASVYQEIETFLYEQREIKQTILKNLVSTSVCGAFTVCTYIETVCVCLYVCSLSLSEIACTHDVSG